MTINIKTILFVCVMSFSLQTFSQDWIYNFNEAVQESKKSDKLVMLVFQGSDWCAPCIKLEKKIWQSEQFKKHSNNLRKLNLIHSKGIYLQTQEAIANMLDRIWIVGIGVKEKPSTWEGYANQI